MELEQGVQRWAVNTSLWHPSPEQFKFCLSLLPLAVQDDVTRFVMVQDRKRALVSRLLQLQAVHSLLHIPYDDILLQRTKEGKPYLANKLTEPAFPNFNFNVSHHGDFVVLASEPLCLVGVDVMTHEPQRSETAEGYLTAFKTCFTAREWKDILGAGPGSGPILDQFLRFWCMKEAYIKAVGIGLGFDLQRAEFRYPGDYLWENRPELWMDGQRQDRWSFYIHDLGNNHWACVAKGPPKDATEGYKKWLARTDFDDSMYVKALGLPDKAFSLMEVDAVLPPNKRQEYIVLSGLT